MVRVGEGVGGMMQFAVVNVGGSFTEMMFYRWWGGRRGESATLRLTKAYSHFTMFVFFRLRLIWLRWI